MPIYRTQLCWLTNPSHSDIDKLVKQIQDLGHEIVDIKFIIRGEAMTVCLIYKAII